ncbi:Lipoprotein spr [Clonorchis sinensis]|uniref:Lipoprotein spr n=2 Tax=Clonorchis sinensis TaxID=79923 RepID=A0A8T1MCC5_CLOSI|nr:Lipoprotein spr [Clonorchis sinensis]GAA48473.1 sepiapterin reductase [Clonorchis sinensis]
MSDCSCQREDQIKSPWENSNCNVVVTGASRGFGRAFCLKLTEALTKEPGAARSINMLLMARDLEALNQTKDQVVTSKAPKSPTKVNVLISRPGLDMVNISEPAARAALQPLFDLNPKDQLEKETQWNLLVHNAATIGSVVLRADERTSIASLENYYRANLLAPMIITGVFLSHFAPFGSNHPPLMVVNVSSLFAMQTCPFMSDYCVGKAARHMYLKTLSTDRPTVAVFNYSPGPLDTDMFNELMLDHADPNRRAWAENLKKSGGVLIPDESARICVSWLRRCHYNNSGDGDAMKLRPESVVCPIHQKEYMDIWTGTNLDYFDALAIEQALNKQLA